MKSGLRERIWQRSKSGTDEQDIQEQIHREKQRSAAMRRDVT